VTSSAPQTSSAELLDKVTLLASVAATMGDGLLAFDTEYRCIFWSSRMIEISGMSELEANGTSVIELLPFLGEQGGKDRLLAALAGDLSCCKDRLFAGPGAGKRGFLDVYFVPICAASGDVLAAAAIVRDITEQKVAEQHARETELRFKNMADAAPVLLWMSDADGLCTFFNQTWLEYTGRSLAEEWGVGWAEGVHFEDFQRCMDTYVDAFNARRRFEMEYRLRRADGEYRWMLDRGSPRYTPMGEFVGYIGSCADITDRKRIEGDLRRAVRDRDEFLSIAAHELRTPLTSLQLQVERMANVAGKLPEDGPATERLQTSSQSALRQMRRMVGLVEQLLDLSRLTVGILELTIERADLRSIALEVVERFDELAKRAGCALSVYATEEFPGYWDRHRLEQVLSNLVSNAVKYAPGQPVDVTLERVGDRARVVVRDNGTGIDPADQARIFDRFERAGGNHTYAGFGLGLWIARQLVEAHGGTIGVESRLGEGAAFIVEVPFDRRSDAIGPSPRRVRASESCA
jgi:PAS domain S-box-containing protein